MDLPEAVEIKGLTKNYGAGNGILRVLHDVNLHVGNNEFVSFLSPSGCGKSTLFRLVAGLESDYEGTITIHGMDIKEKRIPVRYMLQKDLLMPWRTLEENVLLPYAIWIEPPIFSSNKIFPVISWISLFVPIAISPTNRAPSS